MLTVFLVTRCPTIASRDSAAAWRNCRHRAQQLLPAWDTLHMATDIGPIMMMLVWWTDSTVLWIPSSSSSLASVSDFSFIINLGRGGVERSHYFLESVTCENKSRIAPNCTGIQLQRVPLPSVDGSVMPWAGTMPHCVTCLLVSDNISLQCSALRILVTISGPGTGAGREACWCQGSSTPWTSPSPCFPSYCF